MWRKMRSQRTIGCAKFAKFKNITIFNIIENNSKPGNHEENGKPGKGG